MASEQALNSLKTKLGNKLDILWIKKDLQTSIMSEHIGISHKIIYLNDEKLTMESELSCVRLT